MSNRMTVFKDPDAPLLARLLAASAYSAHSLSLINSPGVESARRIFREPEPGDYVMEVSSYDKDGMGRLICVRDEFVPWEDDSGGYDDKFTYIETFDGKLGRWFNCNFIRMLDLPLFMLKDTLHDPEARAWAREAAIRYGIDTWDGRLGR